MLKLTIFVTLSICSTAWAYSSGAPESVCSDMTPKHPVDPQKTKFPYKISVSKNEVKSGETVDITVGGDKNFKGYLLQVRDGDKAVGTFVVSDSDKYTRAINCNDIKGVSTVFVISNRMSDKFVLNKLKSSNFYPIKIIVHVTRSRVAFSTMAKLEFKNRLFDNSRRTDSLTLHLLVLTEFPT